MPNSRMVNARKTSLQQRPCGIITVTALWVLCRYRHKTHWSGSERRLARTFGKKFGDHAYAIEELTAELTSAILGSELELPVSHLDDHASYIASWIRVLKTDSKAILTIASKAEEAASYLLALAGRTPEPEPQEVETGANDDAPAHAAALVA